MLETFAFVRHLVLNGAMSEAVATLSALLAGSSFAIDALFMVLIGPCDHLAASHQVELCLFVDDLTIDAVGTAEFVQHTLPAAVRDCIDIHSVSRQGMENRQESKDGGIGILARTGGQACHRHASPWCGYAQAGQVPRH